MEKIFLKTCKKVGKKFGGNKKYSIFAPVKNGKQIFFKDEKRKFKNNNKKEL